MTCHDWQLNPAHKWMIRWHRSQPGHPITTAVSGSKWHHQHKIAALVSRMSCFHLYLMGVSGTMSVCISNCGHHTHNDSISFVSKSWHVYCWSVELQLDVMSMHILIQPYPLYEISKTGTQKPNTTVVSRYLKPDIMLARSCLLWQNSVLQHNRLSNPK